MNIFAIDEDPTIAAQNLCDLHCNKMLLESCQILANCFSLERLSAQDCPRNQKGQPRKHSYYNHPSCKWARETKDNMIWLIVHALEMEAERLARGFNPHFSFSFLNWTANNVEESEIQDGAQTDFSIAISPNMNCRKVSDFDNLHPIQKYRLYYKHDKLFAYWKRNRPDWIDWPDEKIINES